VLRQAYERASMDGEVIGVFRNALDELKAAGAEVVDPAAVEDARRPQGTGTCRGFKYDLDDYLARRGQRAPVHSLDEIIASGKFHPSVEQRLRTAQRAAPQGPESEACRAEMAYRDAFGTALTKSMDGLRLDAFVYPTWSNPPRLIGDLSSPAGDNSQVYAPTPGFPAINVPMGYTRGNQLPAGMTFLGRAWDEPTLIRLAFAYEHAAPRRHAPASTPPLK
jgi:amidase